MKASEAKKVIEMCTDTMTDGSKKYVSLEYVLNILDMIDVHEIVTSPFTKDRGNSDDNWIPTFPKVWYGNNSPRDAYGNPVPYCGHDINLTGSKPEDADINVISGACASIK